MKKSFLTVIGILCAYAAFGYDADAVKNLGSSDVVAADAARLSIQKEGGADVLFAALPNAKNKKLRDGLIYSLGSLKYEPAYDTILKIATAEKDSSPAAILAIAQFRTERALADLSVLEKSGSLVAKSAIFAYFDRDLSCPNSDSAGSKWDSFSENEKIWILHNLDSKGASADFVKKVSKCDSQRVASACAFALARFGGEQNAVAIFEIAKNFPEAGLELAVADCSKADATILSEIAKRNAVAVRAATLRNVSAAETPLLKLLSETSDARLKREIYEALKAVGSEKTAVALVDIFASADNADILNCVKTLPFVCARIDDKAKAAVLAKLGTFDGDTARAGAAKKISETLNK